MSLDFTGMQIRKVDEIFIEGAIGDLKATRYDWVEGASVVGGVENTPVAYGNIINSHGGVSGVFAIVWEQGGPRKGRYVDPNTFDDTLIDLVDFTVHQLDVLTTTWKTFRSCIPRMYLNFDSYGWIEPFDVNAAYERAMSII